MIRVSKARNLAKKNRSKKGAEKWLFRVLQMILEPIRPCSVRIEAPELPADTVAIEEELYRSFAGKVVHLLAVAVVF